MKEAAFRTWMSWKTPEAADGNSVARWAAALVVAVAKTRAWEDFGDTMDKDL